LVHMIDVSGLSGRDPMRDFESINEELKAHSERLASLPQIVALNKVDMPGASEIVDQVKPHLEARGFEVFEISALTGQGIQPLLYRIAEKLDELPREEYTPIEEIAYFTVEREESTWDARRIGEHEFIVEGRPVEKLVQRTDLNNEYALRRLHRQLEKMGVIKRLRDLGAQHGDAVKIANTEFDFVDEELW